MPANSSRGEAVHLCAVSCDNKHQCLSDLLLRGGSLLWATIEVFCSYVPNTCCYVVAFSLLNHYNVFYI